MEISLKNGLDILPEIQKIGKFLYDVYIEEPGQENEWKFAADNPSKITVEIDETGNKMLLDKFMKEENLIKKTTWALAKTQDNEIIGCTRMIIGFEIEISGYQHHATAIKDLLQKHEGSEMIEMNRLAVHKNFRKQLGHIMLIAKLASWRLENTSICLPIVWTKATNMTYQLPIPHQPFGDLFKYEDTDPFFVQLYEAKSFEVARAMIDFKEEIESAENALKLGKF